MRAPRVVQQVRHFMAGLACGRLPGVVAVSGGADSVALLRALLDAGYSGLTVGHVNHQLRGDESDGDEAFVKHLADSLGVGFRSIRIDMAKEAAGDNLEATARRVRYDWLSKVAAEVGASWIATGHTADDQAETVLHRLIRGTGLRGLRGIREAACGFAIPGTAKPQAAEQIIRPLLTVTRAELLDYLAGLGQPFRTDSSNADPRFTRNRIRAELVPLLKTFNPEVVDVLGRLAYQADEAHAVIAEQATGLLAQAERPRAGEFVILDCETLSASRSYLIGEVLRLLWEREGWPMGEMTANHWNRVVDVARGERVAAEFPSGVTVRRVGRVVQLRRGS